MTVDEIWDRLIDELIDEGTATEDELRLVIDIIGYTREALYDVLYFEQMEDEL